MSLSWPYFLAALVLLWTPLIRCLGRSRRRHLLHPECNGHISPAALLVVGWNWLDMVRAGAGAWVLVTYAILPPLDTKESALPSIIARVIVLGIGVGVQAIGNNTRFDRLMAPIFYLLGFSVVLLPWQTAVFGGLLALVLADMLRGWIHLFWLMPVCLVAGLKLFGDLGVPALMSAALWAIPGALSLIHPNYYSLWVPARMPSAADSGGKISAGDKVKRLEGGKVGR